ncbi:KilA-N domain-containing protein [Ferrimonas sp. YFM]|uniref:KilA-N domain-containing protein n=1 Tax=Ferrimonas sp. YFM TaxID=3028878 RepID=UPI002572D8CA|nr:KilA-N domain-containing protein [Ferrimonas sp. YFM]BDY05391.1 hypothetical protein F0521_24320 [Ferrimonas sp. YFM]
MINVTLTFNEITATISSNEHGMFDLNEVHSHWLSGIEAKRPNRWVRTAVARDLMCTKNAQTPKLASEQKLLSLDNGGSRSTKTYVADQDALISYAMWADKQFHRKVLKAFRQLANNDAAGAMKTAQSAMTVEAREKLRVDSKSFSDAISKAQDNEQLSASHGFVHVRNLAAKAVTGFGTVAAFRQRHGGLTPREYYAANDDWAKLMELGNAEAKIEALLQAGMDYQGIKGLLAA